MSSIYEQVFMYEHYYLLTACIIEEFPSGHKSIELDIAHIHTVSSTLSITEYLINS
jgi:hypothetical protein